MSTGASSLSPSIHLKYELANPRVVVCLELSVDQVISSVEHKGEKELNVMVKEDFDTTDSNARYLGE